MCAITGDAGVYKLNNLLCACRWGNLFSLRAVAIVLSAAFPLIAMAQTTGAATLVGTVTDPSGLAVPGAKLTLVNTETSFRSETVTSTEGSYVVPYLSPGTYQITLEAAGFK